MDHLRATLASPTWLHKNISSTHWPVPFDRRNRSLARHSVLDRGRRLLMIRSETTESQSVRFMKPVSHPTESKRLDVSFSGSASWMQRTCAMIKARHKGIFRCFCCWPAPTLAVGACTTSRFRRFLLSGSALKSWRRILEIMLYCGRFLSLKVPAACSASCS